MREAWATLVDILEAIQLDDYVRLRAEVRAKKTTGHF
jgi:hypothetical protein